MKLLLALGIAAHLGLASASRAESDNAPAVAAATLPPGVRVLRDLACAVATNYRYSQQAIFPAQIQDCKAAIRWLRANAQKCNLDSDHFGVWGSSAGGQLVALLETTADVKELEGTGSNVDQSSRVQAVVDWYGPKDLLVVGPKDAAPFLIMHGDQDKTVPISQNEMFAQALKKAGVEVTFVVIKGAGHGGAVFGTPGTLKQIEDFFSKHLT
jgi:acetyl esterase/lipase